MPPPRLLREREAQPASLAALSAALRPSGAATRAATRATRVCSASSRGKAVSAGGGRAAARAQACQTPHSQSTRPTSAGCLGGRAIRALRVVMIEWRTPLGGRVSSGTEAAVSRAQPTNSHASAGWALRWALPSKKLAALPSALHDRLQILDDLARCLALGPCRCGVRPRECLPLRATGARLPRCTPCSARRPLRRLSVPPCLRRALARARALTANISLWREHRGEMPQV